MFAKLLFLVSVCMFIEIGFCGSSSNEHVHIKLHVPEIIKRHTHVRTVYKPHHRKPKPHKLKKPHAKLKHSHFAVAESRPIWIPKPVHHKPKSTEETVPINEWQQKLQSQLKKPKNSKKIPVALVEMIAEAGVDDGYKKKLLKQYQLQEQLRNQHVIPEYMVMDGSYGNEDDDKGDVYAYSPTVEHFSKPQLLKITEADIRPKGKPVPQWGHDSGSQEITYYKKPHEWPKVEPSLMAYQYTTLAPLHLTADDFVPSALIQQTPHSSFEEYPNLFQSNKPKLLDLQHTYTKYKNRQSLKMSNLNTRVN